ncbi:MAG: PilN domain-containing protein [Betaproteobacteria bacterium]|nr:PilN domain-containing protein [Betaproteobacteria bacterium]MBI2960743.1 PilN domain-containing protein [Betaproteobacteria bacterium]
MRALELDFRRETRQTRRVGIALLAAGIASAVVAAGQYRDLADDLALAEANTRAAARATRKQAASPRVSGDLQRISQELKRAGEVALALRTPWNDLFASVESANTPEVALLSIETDTGKRQVKISGEAKDFDAMLEYVRFLGSQPKLADVYLHSHQVQLQSPQRPVRFVLGAEWVSRQ